MPGVKKTLDFTWKGIAWLVKRSEIDDQIVYKDAAHLGGPWSNLAKSLGNSSIHAGFRARLKLMKSILEQYEKDALVENWLEKCPAER